MTLASFVNVSAGIALLAYTGFTLLELAVQSRLELYHGALPLPSGSERWNPAHYRAGATRWLRLDRVISPYGTRVSVALLVLNAALLALEYFVAHRP